MSLRKISVAFIPLGISGILSLTTWQSWQFETSPWNFLQKSAPWPFMFNKMLIFSDSTPKSYPCYMLSEKKTTSSITPIEKCPTVCFSGKIPSETWKPSAKWGRKNKNKSPKGHQKEKWVASLSPTIVFFQALEKPGTVFVWHLCL